MSRGPRGPDSTTDLAPKTLGSSQTPGSRSQQADGRSKYLLCGNHHWGGSLLPSRATASPVPIFRSQHMLSKHLPHARGLWHTHPSWSYTNG